MQLPTYLGGHLNLTHLDHGALEWAINNYEIKSMLDIGCGPGGMVELADKQYSLHATGIDGDFTLNRYDSNRFIIFDFTKGVPNINDTYDLAWSCEFVEHVYEQYLPNYMPCFQKCKMVIMTYAPPGFPGHHHVNCQPEEYWIKKFADYGFRYGKEETIAVREKSTMNINLNVRKQFLKNRGMVFFNEN